MIENKKQQKNVFTLYAGEDAKSSEQMEIPSPVMHMWRFLY